jgi:predicted extracellular nuclease
MHIAGLALKRRTFLMLGAILGLVALVAAQVAAFTPALPTSAAQAPALLAPAVSTTFVISQFEVAGATAADEFIEIHNISGSPQDLNGHNLVYRSAAGTSDVTLASWSTSTVLPAGGYYLVAHATGYTGAVAPDKTYNAGATGSLAAAGGGLALRNGPTNTGPIVDSVGYGSATNAFVETAVTSAPATNTSKVRLAGGCQDTDNNSTDYTISNPPVPHNSVSAPATCGATGTPTATVTPGGPTATPTDTATTTPTATATATVGPPSARIHDIQGAAHRSPLNGVAVSNVPGIVTAKQSNGFYMQDPNPDADDATSEAIFVFGSAAASAVSVGDAVAVSGTVSEFRPGGSGGSDNLTTTEIGSPTVVVVSTGNPLPPPVVIGAGGRMPPTMVIEDDASGDVETSGVFDPATDGIDFYESLEAMRVQVNDAVASGPTSDFGSNREIPVLADNGANAGVRTTRGGIVIRATDFNPERIILNDVISGGPNLPLVNVNDKFPGAIIGIMDYTFGNFKLQVLTLPALVSGGLAREVAAPVTDPDQISFGAFNVENLDPTDPQSKFDTLAGLLVNNLRSPDIISVEEIQDNNGPLNDPVVDASLTWQKLISATVAAGGPTYTYRQIDPVDDQDGGEPGGNIRVGFLFRTDRGVSFIDRPGGTSTAAVSVVNGANGPELSFSPGRIDPTNAAFNSSRKPLAGEFMFNGHHLFVVANHFNSKGGDDPLFGHIQPPVRSSEVQRHQQAQIVHDFVASILALDSNANVIVAGDLNDFEFSDTLNILKAGNALYDLIETLPQEERYTYVFEGNSQAIDHILVSPHIFTSVPYTEDVVHVNSEFADQASDHEPQVARFSLPAGAVTPTVTATATATETAVPPTVTTTAVPPTVTTTALPPTVTTTALPPTVTTTALPPTVTTTALPPTVTTTATATATAGAGTSTATAVANTPTTTAVAGTATMTATTVPSTATMTATAVPATATATPVNCPLPFTDVDQFNPFYQYIQCLYCRGIISGYADNTFRWGVDVTRGQVSKIVANAAGLNDVVTGQTFTDVPPGNPFYDFIERLYRHGYISGYDTAANCPTGIPCFRWELPVTRGQLAKIDANAAGYAETPPTGTQSFVDVPPSQPFYVFIERLSLHGVINGYTCGGPGEPCPGFYYRPNANITRGQTSKVVSQSFFPNSCAPAQPAAVTR